MKANHHAMKLNFKTGSELITYISDHGIVLLDCCFTDPLGQWHHCTMSADQLDEKVFEEGFAFDGSSIR